MSNLNKEAIVKKFLFVSLIVLVVAAVVPQPAAAGFGLKGGLAQSNLDFSPSALIPLGNLNAPTGGVFWGFNLGLFTIQPEALYVRMGTHVEEGADWMEDRLDYIQIPVLLKLGLLPGPVKLVIYGGGYYSFLLSAKGVANIDGEEDSTDIKDQVKSNDYGAVFGGGIDFHLAAIKLSAEVRYNLGLANINSVADDTTSVKNHSLMFLVGIGF
jgi:Outer membrane protein beta-barrel domain